MVSAGSEVVVHQRQWSSSKGGRSAREMLDSVRIRSTYQTLTNISLSSVYSGPASWTAAVTAAMLATKLGRMLGVLRAPPPAVPAARRADLVGRNGRSLLSDFCARRERRSATSPKFEMPGPQVADRPR